MGEKAMRRQVIEAKPEEPVSESPTRRMMSEFLIFWPQFVIKFLGCAPGAPCSQFGITSPCLQDLLLSQADPAHPGERSCHPFVPWPRELHALPPTLI